MPIFEFNKYRPDDTGVSKLGMSISHHFGPDLVSVAYILDLVVDAREFTAEVQQYYRYTGNGEWMVVPFEKHGGMNKLYDSVYNDVPEKDRWYELVEPLIELMYTPPVNWSDLTAFRAEYIHTDLNKLEDQLAELKKLASS
ncbi:hypothetical protein KHQ84_gp184 [Rhodococcus phage Finch]|uniref:Uncharacterized protein n=1 Tax=Rhodococcus phage Finch TaxID=2094144 RepID=A0A2P1JXP4_9CAUD|nr:hypothetical protein KHQ84_gp184 [Rhodococcus phage Finch]AVO25109.1 hypothetical protein SEA_FINCH_184 [Rhodococcus phage Finch]